MKNLFVLALALTASASLCARQLTPQEALQRARNNSANLPARAISATPAADMTLRQAVAAPEASAPALYLFADGEKMVILPADDRVASPMLGYIDSNASGELPPQMQWWLEEYARQIEFLAASTPDTAGDPVPAITANPFSSAPSAPRSAARKAIAPMLSTLWNQSAPYNNQCPLVNGNRSVTGCVATAGAQVMKYFNYPPKGTGSIRYDDNGTTRSMDFSAQAFDWDNMLDSYTASDKGTQADAVAYLMKAVGYGSKMNYSPSASGAQSSEFLNAAVKYFGYNSKATFMWRDNYTISQWEDMIYNNLQGVGPVYMSGATDSNEGHAFVADGYSSDGFFHFNWGWGGMYDGYFKLSALNPEGQGIGGSSTGGGFNFRQGAILNLTTPTSPTVDLPAVSPITLYQAMSTSLNGYSGVTITGTDSDDLLFYNSSSSTVSVELGYEAVNIANGQSTFEGAGQYTTIQSYYGTSSYSLFFDLPAGTYNIYLVAREKGGEWLRFAHSVGIPGYFTITVNAAGELTATHDPAPGTITAKTLTLDSPLYWSKAFKVSYSVANQGESYLLDGVYPGIFTISNSGQASLIAKGDATVFDLEPGASQSVECATSMAVASQSFSGQAYLGLISVNNSTILKYIPVTIKTATTAKLSKTAFSFVGDAKNADANKLQFNCGVKCTSGYYAAPITIAITGPNGGDVLAMLNSESYYFLEAGNTATTQVSGPFPGAVPGSTYTAFLADMTKSQVDILGYLDFTVTNGFSAVDSPSADAADAIRILVDRNSATAHVAAPEEISSVELFTIDGRSIPADITPGDTSATIPLASLPSGVFLLRVTLSSGATSTLKAVK